MLALVFCLGAGTGVALPVPLDGSRQRPEPERLPPIELDATQVLTTNDQGLRHMIAGDDSKLTLDGANAGIVAASGRATVTLRNGVVEQIRADGQAKVTLEGGSVSDPDVAVRAGDVATVTISGGNVIGRIVAEQSAVVVVTGGSVTGPFEVSGSAAIELHVRSVDTPDPNLSPPWRRGWPMQIRGELSDGTSFNMAARLLTDGRMVLHQAGRPPRTLRAKFDAPPAARPPPAPARTGLAINPAPVATTSRFLLAPLAVLFVAAALVAAQLAARRRAPDSRARLRRLPLVLLAAVLVTAPLALAFRRYLAWPFSSVPQSTGGSFTVPMWLAYAAVVVGLTIAAWAVARRRLLTLVTWACVLLFVAGVAIWLRSYHHTDTLTRHTLTPRPGVNHHHTITLQSSGGGLRLHARSHPAANGIPDVHRADLSTRVNWQWSSASGHESPAYPITANDFATPSMKRWGLLLLDGSKLTDFVGHADRRTTVVVPLWLIALPAAVPALLYLYAAARRSRRFAANHCGACGYDLRASSGRCPECGAPIEHAGRDGSGNEAPRPPFNAAPASA
jgi:hypothetical protein